MTALVVFDLDGTLIDSAEDIRDAMVKALAEEDIVLDSRTQVPVGPVLHELLASLVPDADAGLVGRIAARFRSHYDESGFPRTAPMPGANETLRELARRSHPLAIATNKRARPTHALLSVFGWQALFCQVGCSDTPESAGSKERYLTWLAAQFPDRDRVMVGDTEGDMRAASAAGYRAIAYLGGYGKAAELAPRYESIDRLSELTALV